MKYRMIMEETNILRILIVCCALCYSNYSLAEEGVLNKTEHAPIGALITDIGDFDRQTKQFDATFWLWTLTNSEDVNPLGDIIFPNAKEIRDSSIETVPTAKGIWITRKVRGTFRHAWNMTNFPFDSQTLTIRLESSGLDYSRLRFVDDGITSIVDPKIVIPGWMVQGASLYADKVTYHSNFGDPRLPKNTEVTYTAADVSITLKRSSYTAFWKLTIAAFTAAALAIPAFFKRLDAQSRLGLIAASVFADVLSMQSASSDLGAVEYLTLVDQIHILVLIYTCIATVFVLYTHEHLEHHGNYDRLRWGGLKVGMTSTIILFSCIGLLVFRAYFQ